MGAQSVIEHALNQGAGPVCMRPGMGTSASPAARPAPVGVSLAKPSDLRSAWLLASNDLDSLADWFALSPSRGVV